MTRHAEGSWDIEGAWTVLVAVTAAAASLATVIGFVHTVAEARWSRRAGCEFRGALEVAMTGSVAE